MSLPEEEKKVVKNFDASEFLNDTADLPVELQNQIAEFVAGIKRRVQKDATPEKGVMTK